MQAHVEGHHIVGAWAGRRTPRYVGGTTADFGYVDTPVRYQDYLLTRTLSYLCPAEARAQDLRLNT